VNFIKRVILPAPPRDPSTEWHGVQIDPVEVAKREAELEPDRMPEGEYIYIRIRNANVETGFPGEIAEAKYVEHDGKIIVTSMDGKTRYGAAEDNGGGAGTARTLLRAWHTRTRNFADLAEGWRERSSTR
jgi:hypothetical protein